CRVQLRGGTATAGDTPPLPPGVKFHCWNPNSTGEFVREILDGVPAVGIASRSGDPTQQMAIDLTGEAGVKLAAAVEDKVGLLYQSRGGAAGYVSAQNKDKNFAALGSMSLPDTGGAWKTVEFTFRRPGEDGVQLGFDSQPATSGMLFVAALDVYDPAAAPVG